MTQASYIFLGVFFLSLRRGAAAGADGFSLTGTGVGLLLDGAITALLDGSGSYSGYVKVQGQIV